MERIKKGLRKGLMVGLLVLVASPALARSISMKEAGITLWVFIIVGAIIILLQLIPAMILFFSFVGGGTTMILKGKSKAEEVTVPAIEPATVGE